MIIGELRKIFAPRMVILLLVVASVLYVAWPMSQMNLSHLPLFETVELECGKELLETYGTTFDAREIDEIEKLAVAAEEDFDKKVMDQFPEIEALGFHSYDEFIDFYVMEENLEREDLEDLYSRIWNSLGKEMDTKTYYEQLCIGARWDFADHGVEEVSALPQSVFSNTNFVLEDSFRILMYLVWILVLPYLAWDNLSGISSLIATSKCGRKFVLKQFVAMLMAVTIVVTLWCLAIYLGLRICTDYEPFFACPATGIAGGLTFHKFIVVKLVLVAIAAIGLSMIFFFVSSFCKTIVGTVAAAIPCWGVGEVLSIFVLNNFLAIKQPGIGMSMYNDYMAGIDNFSLWFNGALWAIGIVLIGVLYYLRKTDDILE